MWCENLRVTSVIPPVRRRTSDATCPLHTGPRNPTAAFLRRIGRNTTCSPDRYRENSAIDYCEACGGYLKTYDGEGNESVLLADWTSLHLDILARDRGLKRRAASLYDL